MEETVSKELVRLFAAQAPAKVDFLSFEVVALFLFFNEAWEEQVLFSSFTVELEVGDNVTQSRGIKWLAELKPFQEPHQHFHLIVREQFMKGGDRD